MNTPERVLADAALNAYSATLDELESTRIAAENRLRDLQARDGMAAAGHVLAIEHIVEATQALEHEADLALRRAMRQHPLGAWIKSTKGVGERQGARLLATLGDPAERPNPAKLWQYAGHGDPERSRKRKGQTVEFNPTAKMRAHLVAEAAIKSGIRKTEGCDDSEGYDLAHRVALTPLGQVYLNARASWTDRDTTDLHKHNHALRLTAKAMLLDLWREARRVGGHDVADAHIRSAPRNLDDRKAA